jgi:hypothetical protein
MMYENQFNEYKLNLEENDAIEEIKNLSLSNTGQLETNRAIKNYVNYKHLKPTKHNLEKHILKSRLIRYNDRNDHNLEEIYDVIKI